MPPAYAPLAGPPATRDTNAATPPLPPGCIMPHRPLPPPPTLLTLPDAVVVNVLEQLDPGHGAHVACARGGSAVHLLAAAHPRFDRLRRHDVVTRLDPRHGAPPEEVQRLLVRHPRARVLVLREPDMRRLPLYGAARLRELYVGADEYRPHTGGLQVYDVRGLLGACPNLEVLALQGEASRYFDDGDVQALVAVSSRTLRVLKIIVPAKFGDRPLTDVGGIQLQALRKLQELDLTRCTGVGGDTFDAIATLPVLEKLTLRGTNFSDVDAPRTLPRMVALLNLKVSLCVGLGVGLWDVLPPALRMLDVDISRVLRNDTFFGSSSTRALHTLNNWEVQSDFQLRDWSPLAIGFNGLRILDLKLCVNMRDNGAETALRSMPHLEHLVLAYCRNLGRITFDAIATLSALTRLNLIGTSFSDADAARILPQMLKLRILFVQNCNGITSSLWDSLPPQLEGVNASSQVWKDSACGENGAKKLRYFLYLDHTGIAKSWSALASGFSELRLLSVNATSLGDDGVGDALTAMPKLQTLIMFGCRGVGDETAFSIVRHQELRAVDLRRTSVGPTGAHALRRWENALWPGQRNVYLTDEVSIDREIRWEMDLSRALLRD